MTAALTPSGLALDDLARQLAVPVARLLPAGDALHGAELAETIPVWSISSILPTTMNLSSVARFHEIFHHQVLMNAAPAAYARSKLVDGRLQLLGLLGGTLASHVADGLAWVSANVQGEPQMRLVDTPSRRVTALWIVAPGDSRVIVVDAPSASGFHLGSDVMDERSFIESLQATAVIHGRIPPQD